MKLVVACALLFVLAAAGPRAQSPSKEEVLRRAAQYLFEFVAGLSNVVAEEEYQQSFQQGAGRRRLKSDFLLVKYPGAEANFLAFRDVIAVDGKPVTDQQDRLLKLFVEPFENPLVRASEIADASARHSVARGRLANPLFVIALLQVHYQPRFRFAFKDLEPKLGPGVREIELFENVSPKPSGPQPIHAVAWVEEATGRVVKTELRDSYVIGGTRISLSTAGDQYVGIAKYSRFRRFQVHAEETIETPSPR